MEESKTSKHHAFNSVSELVEAFDSGDDMSDYLSSLPEVQFDVDIKKRTHLLLELEGELVSKLAEIARQRQTSTEALIDSWLREKVEQTVRV